MKSFAIVLVCYNRTDGLRRLLSCLSNANYNGRKDIHLIFSIDYSGSNSVQELAQKFEWHYGEKHIRVYDKRQGLKKHILNCGDYTEEYDIITVLEDDIYLSDSFYNYAYSAAEFYYNDDNIAGISLYSFQKNWLDWVLRFEPQRYGDNDVFFLKVAQSWGQVWTKRKWKPFRKWLLNNSDFLSDVSDVPDYLLSWPETSWLKYHDKYLIKTNKYFVYPYISLSTNFSDPGEHSKFLISDHQVELIYDKKSFVFPKFDECCIRYDQYMDREGLDKILGLEDGELNVDFWGTKPPSTKRYLLTTEFKNYKIIKSFQLSLRPIELSVINGILGNGIYLYDTKEQCNNRRFNGRFNRYNYSIRSGESHKILLFAMRLRYSDLKKRIQNKLNRIIKS